MQIRDTTAQDKPIVRTRDKKRLVLRGVLVIALLAALLTGYSAVSDWLGTDQTVPRDRIRTAIVERGDFVRDVGVQGRIVAAFSPTLYAPASGAVTLMVQAGDTVELGQPLATLDSPEVISRFRQEQSELDRLRSEYQREAIESRKMSVANQQTIDLAEVDLAAAEREMRRAERSKEINAISEADYEQFKDELARAKVAHAHAIQDAELEQDSQSFEIRTRELNLERQSLVVDELKRQVDELSILSPVAGMVGTVVIEQKAVVAANSPILTVIDLTAYEVEVSVPESYADDLGIGMAAEVSYNGELFAAEISSLSPEVTNNEVTGRMRFNAVSPPGLRQNQRVTARILIDQLSNILKIRRGAFADSNAGVFVLNGENEAWKQRVQFGARSVSEIEVLSGLNEGDEIIISSMADYTDIDSIRIVN